MVSLRNKKEHKINCILMVSYHGNELGKKELITFAFPPDLDVVPGQLGRSEGRPCLDPGEQLYILLVVVKVHFGGIDNGQIKFIWIDLFQNQVMYIGQGLKDLIRLVPQLFFNAKIHKTIVFYCNLLHFFLQTCLFIIFI